MPLTDPAETRLCERPERLERPRRALILAGGGTKVAFQAGVLQVWLDEAGIEFDLADGASGGVFNLAMWCQGMSGTQIADNWRANSPIRGIQPSLNPFRSLFRLTRFRDNVMRDTWGLSWDAIRATDREATFNLYDFTHHDQQVVEACDMDEDRLISAVSLPMWFPPVEIDGSKYVDAVMATDANLDEAIRRGADELWVIWTVSTRGTWHHGFVAHYFQMIEAMANGQLRAILRRIDANNAAIEAGGRGEFARPIDVVMLEAEVPLHYLLNFTRDRMAAAVELGVAAGRRWCDERAIAHEPIERRAPERGASVRFTEEMKGHVHIGSTDPADVRRHRGSPDYTSCMFHLTIETIELDEFMASPDHESTATGFVDIPALGGRHNVERGRFNLFVDQHDPQHKQMRYLLWFTDAEGRALTLAGHKIITDDPGFDMWSDTTTLLVTIVDGHAEREQLATASIVAAGTLHIRPLMFARQLTTFRARGGSIVDRARSMIRFGRLFIGALWDVYLTRLLPNSPF